MKTVIIHDSLYGNTKKVAEAMAAAFAPSDVKLISIPDIALSDLASVDLLIVGSPTHGGRPKPSTQDFLKQIPQDALKGVSVAAFDTRFLAQEQNFALRSLMKIIGYAAPRIADALVEKGGTLIAPPEGFIVAKNGKEDSLKDSELERALSWAKHLR